MSHVNDLVFRWSAVSALGKGWINEELIDKYGLNAVDGIIKWSVEQIRNLPAEVPFKEGQWIENPDGTYSCSLCGAPISLKQHWYAHYCLCCGGKMRSKGVARI